MRPWVLLTLGLLILNACAPFPPPERPILKTDTYPDFRDEQPFPPLKIAMNHSLKAMPPSNLEETLSSFLAILEQTQDANERNTRIQESFDLYEVSEPVLFTGYYEPVLQGSPVETKRFRYPLYKRPDDLNQNKKSSCLWMLAFMKRNARFYSREEIDTKGALSERRLELLYLDDPVERFFLHVQGSGTIVLPDKRMVRLQYAGSNGRPYTPIGRILIEEGVLSPEEVTLPKIKQHLRSHPEDQERIMNRNQRYIFFKTVKGGTQGVDNIPLTPLRSLATDPSVIPVGSLLYYVTSLPVFDEKRNLLRWEEQAGFAVSQDIGEAIRGPFRADIFLGQGVQAAATAGHLKSKGKLYILLRKKIPKASVPKN